MPIHSLPLLSAGRTWAPQGGCSLGAVSWHTGEGASLPSRRMAEFSQQQREEKEEGGRNSLRPGAVCGVERVPPATGELGI